MGMRNVLIVAVMAAVGLALWLMPMYPQVPPVLLGLTCGLAGAAFAGWWRTRNEGW